MTGSGTRHRPLTRTAMLAQEAGPGVTTTYRPSWIRHRDRNEQDREGAVKAADGMGAQKQGLATRKPALRSIHAVSLSALRLRQRSRPPGPRSSGQGAQDRCSRGRLGTRRSIGRRSRAHRLDQLGWRPPGRNRGRGPIGDAGLCFLSSRECCEYCSRPRSNISCLFMLRSEPAKRNLVETSAPQGLQMTAVGSKLTSRRPMRQSAFGTHSHCGFPN